MVLKLLTPTQVVIHQQVTKVIAEGVQGCFCLLPRHIDFLAKLVPGLLQFEDTTGSEHFAAVDEGFLVKCGPEVLVSTRQATRGTDLTALRDVVTEHFLVMDERERAAHSAAAKLEANFLRKYLDLAETR